MPLDVKDTVSVLALLRMARPGNLFYGSEFYIRFLALSKELTAYPPLAVVDSDLDYREVAVTHSLTFVSPLPDPSRHM